MSASTLLVMLGGPSSVFLQVAEYKESSKYGSYTALSISLGHILMQLHTGLKDATVSYLGVAKSTTFHIIGYCISFLLMCLL